MCPETKTPAFSLIVCTIGRVAFLRKLFASLREQTLQDFEVILVDQSETSEVRDLCKGTTGLNLSYLHSNRKGLSHARNLGIAHARGAFIAFPDDDCTYLPNTLQTALDCFLKHREVAATNGIWIRPGMQTSANSNASNRNQFISFGNFHKKVYSITIFLRAQTLKEIGGFDERLGVGARFGAGEESDLTIRIMAARMKIVQCDYLHIAHPITPDRKDRGPDALARICKYGEGFGFLIGKHIFSRNGMRVLPYASAIFLRPLAGMFAGICSGNRSAIKYYAYSFLSRIRGCFSYIRST